MLPGLQSEPKLEQYREDKGEEKEQRAYIATARKAGDERGE
jgi:hypothetical protein